MIFCKLSELQEGSIAIVRAIEQEDISLKMLEMGIVPGESIRMEVNKGVKNPLVVHVGTSSISLRRDEAEQIVIECHI